MATASDAAGQRPGPVNLPFPLQDNEDILLVCRRHWVFLWPRTILWAALAVIPVAAVAWLLFRVGSVGGQAAMIFWLVALVYLLAWAVRIFLNWYQYDNDLWVITNQRVVDSIKPNPFGLRISTADLVNIQDMTVVRSGILATALNYGDIVCQTAADNRDFTLGGIPRPQDVQLLMDRERDRERMRARGA
jgi:signal transduction histidine kinase